MIDKENEYIDMYLRDELHGAELESFLKKLNNDPILQKEVEAKKIIVEGIREFGKTELKNYIRKHTHQKQIMNMSYRAFWYAAASVLFIAIGGGLIYSIVQNNKTNSNTAQNYIIDSSGNPVKEQKPTFTEDKIAAADKKTKYENRTFNAETLENPAANASAGIEKDQPVPMEADKTPIAEEVQLTGIKNIRPIFVDLQPKAPAPKQKTEFKYKPGGYGDVKIDSVQPINVNLNALKVNFYNSNSVGNTAVINSNNGYFNKNNNAQNNEVSVYNVNYDKQALVYFYQNKYYLKSGVDYYEIDLTKEINIQNGIKVSDVGIINTLNNYHK